MFTTLAEITLKPLWEEHGIALAVMGMLVVFSALVLVVTFITLLPHLMSALDRLHPEPGKSQSTSQPREKPAESDLPEEIIVVIAAAVAESISTPHRIIHTRQLAPAEHGWPLEGRMQQHTSHAGIHREGH